MAQSDIIIKNKSGDINTISIAAENARPAATLYNLNQSFFYSFVIQSEIKEYRNFKIHLKISNVKI
jgi:hypothetical protein